VAVRDPVRHEHCTCAVVDQEGERLFYYAILDQKISPVLALVTKAPWYVSNFTIHNDLQIPFVIEEKHRLSTSYHQSILGHNRLVVEVTNPPTVTRRLKREWPSDLPQPADDKN
jgi:hypothetical protein